MKNRILILAAVCLVTAPCFADSGDEDDSRKYNFGVRVDYLGQPFKAFMTSVSTLHTDKPIADYTFTGFNAGSSKVSGGPVFEMRLFRHISLGAELAFHSATDNRPVTTYTETTSADYWDIPILLRYHGWRQSGKLKRFYPLLGATMRVVGKVRTGNDILNADGSTDYNEIAATPSHRFQVGATAGIGFRLVDELGIKLVPEIRFTRWISHTFEGQSFASSPNQAQIGLGVTF
jgi:hypothetical protein